MEALDKCLRDGTKYDYSTRTSTPAKYFNFSNVKKFISILEEETDLIKNLDFAFMYDRARYSQKIHLVKMNAAIPSKVKVLEISSSITEVFVDEWEHLIEFLTT